MHIFPRHYCHSTKYRGLVVIPFKVKDAHKEFKEKCPTLCACLEATNKGEYIRWVYAAAIHVEALIHGKIQIYLLCQRQKCSSSASMVPLQPVFHPSVPQPPSSLNSII